MRNLDFYNDPARSHLPDLLNRVPFAKVMLKAAEVEDNLDAYDDRVFADPKNRRFPLHTKTATTLSYLYAKYANEAVDGYVMDQITHALEAYGLNVDDLQARTVKRAALTEDECLFPEQQAYPVRDAHEVKLAEEALLSQHRKLLPLTKARVFGKLASAAEIHGVKLSNESMALAGRAGSDPVRVLAAIRQRVFSEKAAEDTSGIVDGLAKVHDQLHDQPSALRDRGTQIKVAALLAKADKALGLQTDYVRGIIDPISAVFSPEKVASADAVPLGERYSVSAQDLAKLPASFYSDALGPDFAADAAPGGSVDPSSVAQVLGTLPADMLDGFVGQLRAAGVNVTGQ